MLPGPGGQQRHDGVQDADRAFLTPFMGVGSEVYSPVLLGRRGIGAELKPSYFRQAAKNVKSAADGVNIMSTNFDLIDAIDEASQEDSAA